MKTIKMNQFDKKDEEIADVLISFGISRPVAMTLAYMQNTKSAPSLELEQSARLRQPEVSIATKELMERDWISEREEKKPGKGRPYKIYTLKVGFKDIIAHFESEREKAAVEAQEKIERLKELGK